MIQSLSRIELLADHPRLARLLNNTSPKDGIIPGSDYKWELDDCNIMFHKLSKRWRVRLISMEIPGFSWWMDVKTLFAQAGISFVDSVQWHAYLKSIVQHQSPKLFVVSSRAAELCANLAVRALPGYPATFGNDAKDCHGSTL